ncbi:MAG: hypothetical protein LBK61_04385 [Spirochaetaceae bacterium]|nr:hypothetical protein [Spirochaetaceae bacterium]
MRALRILAASVWYFVCTAVNSREPLFWSALERARFMRVLNEARVRYAFELPGPSSKRRTGAAPRRGRRK